LDLAIDVLKKLDIIKKISPLEDNSGFVIGLNIPGNEAIPQIIEELNKVQYRIRELNLKKPSLDDVFLHYTGRKVRDEPGDVLQVKRRWMRFRRRLG
ncbi:MAG: ATP-binding protein DrrA1-3 family domain-containing protein, partial [Candidatus Helarchaeota archaeon]